MFPCIVERRYEPAGAVAYEHRGCERLHFASKGPVGHAKVGCDVRERDIVGERARVDDRKVLRLPR